MKQLKRFPDYYITEDAEIISKRTKNQKKLNPHVDNHGYLRITLQTPKNIQKSECIQRLMIETYGKEPPKDMKNPTVDHINANKLDNRIDNLQWLSNEDNAYKSAKDRIKSYKIQDKSGEIFIIKNITKWCKENNLDKCSLLRSYNKGWWHKNYKIISK
jgi:hypothetical protein